MPFGSSAPEPAASLVSGTPYSIRPPTPASTAPIAALASESIECWTTPGIELIGRGSLAPSATNIGSTRSCGRTDTSLASLRSAAVRRSRRGRDAGKAGNEGRCAHPIQATRAEARVRAEPECYG